MVMSGTFWYSFQLIEVVIMDNGFSTSDAVLTAAMSGGLNNRNGGMGDWGGGYGYGNAGNSFLAAEAHANGTAVDAKVTSINDTVRLGFDSNQEQIRESRTLDQFRHINDAQFRTELRTSDQHTSMLKNMADVEFRSLDRQRDIERMLVDNAKEAAKCCCETQKLITAEATTTRALMLEVEGRATVASLAAANAKITQLETINALSRGHHGG